MATIVSSNFTVRFLLMVNEGTETVKY